MVRLEDEQATKLRGAEDRARGGECEEDCGGRTGEGAGRCQDDLGES